MISSERNLIWSHQPDEFNLVSSIQQIRNLTLIVLYFISRLRCWDFYDIVDYENFMKLIRLHKSH